MLLRLKFLGKSCARMSLEFSVEQKHFLLGLFLGLAIHEPVTFVVGL